MSRLLLRDYAKMPTIRNDARSLTVSHNHGCLRLLHCQLFYSQSCKNWTLYKEVEKPNKRYHLHFSCGLLHSCMGIAVTYKRVDKQTMIPVTFHLWLQGNHLQQNFNFYEPNYKNTRKLSLVSSYSRKLTNQRNVVIRMKWGNWKNSLVEARFRKNYCELCSDLNLWYTIRKNNRT